MVAKLPITSPRSPKYRKQSKAFSIVASLHFNAARAVGVMSKTMKEIHSPKNNSLQIILFMRVLRVLKSKPYEPTVCV